MPGKERKRKMAEESIICEIIKCILRRPAVGDAFASGRPALLNGRQHLQ